MKSLCFGVFLLFAALAPANAAFQPGDVIVTGAVQTGVTSFQEYIIRYDQFGGSRQVIQSIPDVIYFRPEFAANGNLYAATSAAIDEIAPDGMLAREFGASPLAPVALTLDRAGTIYAGTRQQSAILKISPSGAIVSTFLLPPGGVEAVDLAADQCTLFYLSLSTVGRFDVCSGVPLAPLAVLNGMFLTDLRIMADGSVLVATSQQGSLLRLSSSGAILRDYGIAAQVIALDRTGTAAWVHNVNGLEKVDLNSGAVLIGPIATGIGRDGLAVFGEPRAALGPTSVPALSVFALVTLLMVLAAAGVMRSR